MTVAPAFCARFLGKDKLSKKDLDEVSEEGSQEARTLYERLLRGSLKKAAFTTLVLSGGAGACFLLFPTLGTELFP